MAGETGDWVAAHERVHDLLVGRGEMGATVPEIQHALGTTPPHGVMRPGARLETLATLGRAVALREQREAWPVWVTSENVNGREIAFSGFEDKTEGTDMDDATDFDATHDTEEGGEQVAGAPRYIDLHMPITITSEGELMDLTAVQNQRSTALYHAKSILGDRKESKGPLASPSVIPPTTADLITIAEYIMGGIDRA